VKRFATFRNVHSPNYHIAALPVSDRRGPAFAPAQIGIFWSKQTRMHEVMKMAQVSARFRKNHGRKTLPVFVCVLICFCLRGFEPRPRVRAAVMPASESSATPRFVLDMAQSNSGERPISSAFGDPRRLAEWGYNGQILNDLVEGIATFDVIAPGVVPEAEKDWAEARTRAIGEQIKAAHAAGVKCYALMQVLVLPQAIVQAFHYQICDAAGNIDIERPKAQELFRAQLREIFDRVPELDGLVVRTGEIYLQDLPYHVASAPGAGGGSQTSTSILHGQESHIQILTLLRDEVCVQHNKMVIYRTWDFGNHFHVNPGYYLAVTNAIEPHPNLMFSIKHQAGDFHQLTPFNPTLGIGQHRQIVEVQCQREAYGKGAYPYYIGQGVIDGWEEYAWMKSSTQAKGLRDIFSSPLIAGVWTWSRGGGWGGPYITDEFWCDLNAYVIAKFAENPQRTEAEIFDEYARRIGLRGDDVARFRELNLLSEKAVLRGQLTTLGAKIDLWWARDDTLSAPDLSDFIKRDLVDDALREKHQAVEMWNRIEELSREIHFADAQTQDFVETSCTYGRIKYSLIEQAWTILLYGHIGDATGSYDRPKLERAIAQYDRLWDQWEQLKETHASCSTLPSDLAFGNKPGIGAAVDRYREVILQVAGKY
jgi:hypothetical protein